MSATPSSRPPADAVFGCDIADYNPRSRHAFAKTGFVLDASYPQPPDRKARTVSDLVLWRNWWCSRM